ncbi:MAG TPA: S8 family serine peptidase, partial [Thermoplasmata archaeon]|nr:S8 family serine peptidase [Thermoplasmata archaeon]
MIESYGSFALVNANPSSIASLEARGIAVESHDEGRWISLQSVEIDTRGPAPTISPAWSASMTSAPALYLIHFIGPAKPAWLQELQARGVRVLQSIPTYGFLVSMDAAAREGAAALRYVDWIGPYHPAYKLQSELAHAAGTVTVQVLTVDSADSGEVVALLANHGLPEVRWDSPASGILSVFRVGEMGVVRGRFDASLLPAIAQNPRVMYVEPWHEMRILDYNAQALLQTGITPPSDVNARRLWANGINGAGEIITLGDTGIDFDNNFFRESPTQIQKGQAGDTTGTLGAQSIYNTTDLSRRKLVRYMPMSPYHGIDPWTGGDAEARKDSANNGGCPSGHGTSTSGNAGGSDDPPIGTSNQDGMAVGAKIIIQDIGTLGVTTSCPAGNGDVLSYIPDDYDNLFGSAYAEGSKIHSNSWGGPGNEYDVQAMMVDRFVWSHPDMTIFFAAGNAGANLFTVGSPGISKSTITIGGANEYPGENAVNGQSSRGPTADGRLKPDTLTFFSGVTASSSGNPTDNSNTAATTGFAGTSHATPLGAGMGALIRQYFDQGYYPTGLPVPGNALNPSAALVKAILAASSRKITGTGSNPATENRYPNDAQGWGRLVLDDALYVNPATEGPRKLWVVDQTTGLITGQSIDYKIRVNSNAAPLRILMAYSDYPAFPNSNPSLVNNLNLQVTAPNGSVYKGNVFSAFALGESLPNSGSFDTRNPIEGVIVSNPGVGTWTLHVEGANVPVGPQPFALVAVADIDLGFGDIRLDKTLYSENDTVRIEVHD